MASWEDEDFEPPPPGPPIKSDRWEGEDEDEDVPENWDDEDKPQDSSKLNEPGKPKPLQPKKKTPRQLKEEKRRQEEAEREAARRALQPKSADEILAEKLAKQKIEKERDLELAEEIFAGAGQITVSFDSVKLETIHEFESFRRGMVDKLLAVSSSPHYALFVEDLVRDICAPIDVDDLRKIQATLNALYNEKNKSKKDKPGKPKKKGPKVKVDDEKDMAHVDVYDDLDDII